MEIKFGWKDLQDLDNDLLASTKAIPIIALKTLRQQLAPIRNQMRALIPRTTGRLARSFGYSVRRKGSMVTALFGFMTGAKVSASAAIAANVLQAGGARPRKGAYLWIPLPPLRNADGSAQVSPRQLLNAGGFVAMSKAGNKIAFLPGGLPAFVLKTFVKLSRPPLPVEQRIEAEAPEIASGIEESIASVIEAKRKVQEL